MTITSEVAKVLWYNFALVIILQICCFKPIKMQIFIAFLWFHKIITIAHVFRSMGGLWVGD